MDSFEETTANDAPCTCLSTWDGRECKATYHMSADEFGNIGYNEPRNRKERRAAAAKKKRRK